MANKAQSNIDLNYKQLLNLILQKLSVQPSNPKEGQIYYDTKEKYLMFYNGTEWKRCNQLTISEVPDLSTLYLSTNLLGIEGGVAPLGTGGKINNSYLNIDTVLSDTSNNVVSNSTITTKLNEIANEVINSANKSLSNLNSSGLQLLNTILDTNSQERYDWWFGLNDDYTLINPVSSNTIYVVLDTKNIYVGSTVLLDTNNFQVMSEKGIANGYCPLDENAIVPLEHLPETGANKDLNNLTSFGNTRLYYQPFAINSGTVDANGENNTLYAPGSGTVVQTFEQPTLTSDGTMGTSDFACTCNHGTAYYAFDNNSSTYAGVYGNNSYTCELTFYNKNPLKITQLTILESALGVTTLEYSDDNSTWTQVDTITYTPSSQRTTTWTLTNDTGFHNYYRFTGRNQNGTTNVLIYQVDITGTEQVSVSTADTIFCDPCVITTADGRTQEFTTTSSLSIAGVQGTMYVDTPWIQPVLSANGTLGGDSFAVQGDNYYSNYYPWKAFDNDTSTNSLWISGIGSSLFPHSLIVYNPTAIKVSNIEITNRRAGGYAPTAGNIYGSSDNITWTLLTSFTNSVTSAASSWNIDLNSNDNFYKYYKIEITSAVSGTEPNVSIAEVKLTATYLQEISGGDYSIFKDFSTGALSLGKVTISTATPTNPSSGDYWLDNSQLPLVLKNYSNSAWVVDNSKVLLGECTISSGLVTALTNRRFNHGWNIETPHIVETYQNGTSYYRVYSDGWCEQGGTISTSAGADATIIFLKPFIDTNYTFVGIGNNSSANGAFLFAIYGDKAATYITVANAWGGAYYSGVVSWQASGYIS